MAPTKVCLCLEFSLRLMKYKMYNQKNFFKNHKFYRLVSHSITSVLGNWRYGESAHFKNFRHQGIWAVTTHTQNDFNLFPAGAIKCVLDVAAVAWRKNGDKSRRDLIRGWDGSAGQSTSVQVWQPKFNPWVPHKGRQREPATLQSCLLFYTHSIAMCAPPPPRATHTHK